MCAAQTVLIGMRMKNKSLEVEMLPINSEKVCEEEWKNN